MLLSRLLERTIRIGRLEVIDSDGARHVFAGAQGPSVTIRLHDRSFHRKHYVNPELYIGEAYMDGTLTIETASLSALVEIMAAADMA